MGFFDDIVSDSVAPPWLQQGAYKQGPGVGGRFLQTIGVELDTINARAKQAAYASIPGLGDVTALPLIASDRLLHQGPNESNAAFTMRLTASWDAWAHAGNDWALLQQTLPELLPVAPPVLVVSDTSTWSYYAAGATGTTPPLVAVNVTPQNWNWDNGLVDAHMPGFTAWWRCWLIIGSYAPNAWAIAGPVLGAGGAPVLGNAPTWSLGFFNVPPAFWVNLRRQLVAWKQAGAWIRHIIVSYDSAHYQVDAPAGLGVNPDGTFGQPYSIIGGVYVASRFATSRYVPGAPAP
jgi:hypothetical protein